METRWSTKPSEQPPPAHVLRASLQSSMEGDASGTYWKCKPCLEKSGRSKCFMAPMDDVGLKSLLGIHPLLLQSLSCIDMSMAIEEKYNGFISGKYVGAGLFAAPLVSDAFSGRQPRESDFHQLNNLLLDSHQHNIIIRQYKTVLEQHGLQFQNKALSTESIQKILGNAAKRGPVSVVHDEAHSKAVMTLVEHRKPTASSNAQQSPLAGQVCKRGSPNDSSEVVHSTLAGAIEGHPSRETLIYPYIFTHGCGAFEGNKTEFNHYAKLRMASFLSPFTLVPTYPLHLFLMQQMMAFTTQKVMVLDEQAAKIKKKVPDISEEDLYKRLLKRHLSAEIYGSPSYFRQKLEDLKAMVHTYGLPNFFVTFTADEVISFFFVFAMSSPAGLKCLVYHILEDCV